MCVVLELSLHEAAVLKAMMNVFVGHDRGDRGVSSSIWDAINRIKVVDQYYKLRINTQRSCFRYDRFTVWLKSEEDGPEVH